jgi:hypothetical protein
LLIIPKFLPSRKICQIHEFASTLPVSTENRARQMPDFSYREPVFSRENQKFPQYIWRCYNCTPNQTGVVQEGVLSLPHQDQWRAQKLPVCRPSGTLENQKRSPTDQCPQNVTLWSNTNFCWIWHCKILHTKFHRELQWPFHGKWDVAGWRWINCHLGRFSWVGLQKRVQSILSLHMNSDRHSTNFMCSCNI